MSEHQIEAGLHWNSLFIFMVSLSKYWTSKSLFRKIL